MTFHDNPTSYEELIENAKLSFTKEDDLEKIFLDALYNQRFNDWQWAVNECHLHLKK